MQTPQPSWHSFPTSFTHIFFILICSVFVEEILQRHDHTIMDSFEATWPLSLTLKAQHLLVLDVKLNPLMISSLQRSHGKFLLDYIVGKKLWTWHWTWADFLFFLPSDPESLAIFYRFISFIKKHREFPNWSSDSGHWLESSTNETSFHHQIFCKSNIKRGRT